MRFRSRFVVFVDRFRRRASRGKTAGLYRVSALIRLEARQSMRVRSGRKASLPGRPPFARTRSGLREINYQVNDHMAIIGPRKFRRSNYFNKPVPNIHEFGGTVIARKRSLQRYPERSFMYSAVKSLQRKGKLPAQFKYMMRHI